MVTKKLEMVKRLVLLFRALKRALCERKHFSSMPFMREPGIEILKFRFLEMQSFVKKESVRTGVTRKLCLIVSLLTPGESIVICKIPGFNQSCYYYASVKNEQVVKI